MARITVIPAALVQSWVKKIIPQQLLSSNWGQFSNQFTANTPIPMQSERPIASAVVMKITDDFKNGSYRTTMITLIKGGVTPIGGPNPAFGRETKATMQEVGLFYNVIRVPRVVGDESVEGDVAQYYKIAEQTAGLIAADFVEDRDYAHQRSTVEGADVYLTDTSFWQNSEKGSSINAPLSTVLHPNIYAWISGAFTKNTWSATDATARTNLATLLNTGTTTDTFNMKLLDIICDRAARYIAKLPGMQSEKEVNWVLKVSNNQWLQLMTDSAAGSLQDRLKYTDTEISKVVTGYIGVYRNVMVVVDQRSPIANVTGSTTLGAFEYITAQSDDRVYVLPTGTVGTWEIAMLYGNGAIGIAQKAPLDYVKQESLDYGFESSLCGVMKEGIRRVDVDATDAATAARRNFTSFLVMTATNALTLNNT